MLRGSSNIPRCMQCLTDRKRGSIAPSQFSINQQLNTLVVNKLLPTLQLLRRPSSSLFLFRVLVLELVSICTSKGCSRKMAEAPQPPSSATAKRPQPHRNPSAPLRTPPHRKPPQPQTFRPPYVPTKHPRRSSPLRRLHLCRCCFLTLLLLVLLLAVAAALSYFYFQPKPPSIHLQSLKLSRFHVSITPSGTFLSAAAAATVHATNPNGEIVLSYDPGEVTVSAVDDDGDVGLGEERLVGWRQKGRNSTVVRVETRVEKVAVDDGVGARLKKGFSSKEMKVAVELTTRIGVGEGGGGGGGGWLPVRIRCGEVSLRQMGGGGELPKCTINLLRWINLK